MKKLFILLVIISAAACSKVASDPALAKSFFSAPGQAEKIANSTIASNSPKEQFQSIERISYMQSASFDYAFVFYKTDVATRSLVIKKKRDTPLVNSATVTSCWGDCDCRIKAVLGNDGSIDVSCTCTTCKVVTGAVTFESE